MLGSRWLLTHWWIMTIKVRERQTVPDIAVEHAGGIEAAYSIAEANGISVTAVLSAGQELIIPETADSAVAEWFAKKSMHPAMETDN